MFDDQMSMFELPETITGLSVEKIYATRGKNTVNFDGDICDRYCGVVIGGKTHWIDQSFAHITELRDSLKLLNVFLAAEGYWGTIKSDGSTTWIDQKVANINQGESEIFGSDSKHMARSERSSGGKLWWTVDMLKARYFPSEAP